MKLETLEDGIASLRISEDDAPYLDTTGAVRELEAAVATLRADTTVRAVLVEGGRPYFSAGAHRDLLTDEDARAKIAAFCQRFPSLLLDLPVPSVAAMEGHAVGGGWLIGLWCDVPVHARESLYGANFMQLGFTPGMGSTVMVEAAVGAPLARELLFTGRLCKGKELAASGGPLAHSVVPRAEVREKALAIARDIAEAPRTSLVLLKETLSADRRVRLERALEAEQRMHAVSFGDAEVRAGIDERYRPGSRSED
ncbi:MAG: polyketide synthase [Myxococcota bacterium]